MQKIKLEDGTHREIQPPDKITKATLTKDIREKYEKATAEKILSFLVNMTNKYVEHSDAAGAGYHSAKKLWDRKKNKEMTWEQKVELALNN